MGFMDELKKLAQPYGDDDDFYEGADSAFAPQPKATVSSDQLDFEEAFSSEPPAEEKKPRKPLFSQSQQSQQAQASPDIRPSRPSKKRPASEPQVLLFNPKNFDEAGELATYLSQQRSLVMALEGIPTETARRLLDFISGIAFAMNAKITPVSAKTYFITPENVDLLDVHATQDDNDDNDF